jgi:high-affinity K+ transport system ATPase subunit B
MEDVRKDADVQPNRPIPTRKFISFILIKQRVLHVVLASAVVAVPVVVPLWTSTNLDAGFKTAISVVLLVVVLLAALYAMSEEEGSFERAWKQWARHTFAAKRVRRTAVAEV